MHFKKKTAIKNKGKYIKTKNKSIKKTNIKQKHYEQFIKIIKHGP